jgi:hypothetical protein
LGFLLRPSPISGPREKFGKFSRKKEESGRKCRIRKILGNLGFLGRKEGIDPLMSNRVEPPEGEIFPKGVQTLDGFAEVWYNGYTPIGEEDSPTVDREGQRADRNAPLRMEEVSRKGGKLGTRRHRGREES